jgi:hypothetical protein
MLPLSLLIQEQMASKMIFLVDWAAPHLDDLDSLERITDYPKAAVLQPDYRRT